VLLIFPQQVHNFFLDGPLPARESSFRVNSSFWLAWANLIALNADEGWSRDVSESIAAKVRHVAEHEDRDLDEWNARLHPGARRARGVQPDVAAMVKIS
jgi:hypothetical protein